MTIADEELTRTEQAVAAVRPARTFSWRRWWKRRPIRRALVLLHRWPSLVLGLFLIIETTSGAILLYESGYFRATHAELYTHTAGATPLTADQAIDAVDRAHPDFTASWAARDDGAWIVGNADYSDLYGVDPGTGKVSGPGNSDGGVMGFLVNLHDCALSCEGYPAYQSWSADPIPTLGISALEDITWGGFVLGVLGLLMILLVVTGIVTWWPGRRRISHGVRVRTGKGRFARDYDLHNVIGIIALPFILMWGVTGAAFEFPVVETAWLAITAGDEPREEPFDLTLNAAAKNEPMITTEQAVAVALAQVPGEARWIGRPDANYDFYEIDVASGYGSYAHRAVYSGDAYVLVDPHDATNFTVVDKGTGPLANRLYDKVFEPTHFGWNVNGWWRLLWFAFGMAPLALMVTAVSTWLYRRRTKKRRRVARAET